jgi:hypothetical protein
MKKDQSRERMKSKYTSPCDISTVLAWRLMFIATLLIVAAAFGYVSYYVIKTTETEEAESQYDAIVERALVQSVATVNNNIAGINSIASIMASQFPDADTWPYVYMEDFSILATDVIDIYAGRRASFCPILDPAVVNITEWENFAYSNIEAQYGPGVGSSPLGRGMYLIERPDQLLPPTFKFSRTGETDWGNNYTIVVPLYQHSTGPFSLLMYNVHSFEQIGRTQEALLRCAEARQLDPTLICNALSDTYGFKESQGAPEEPGTYLVSPIYPRKGNSNNGTKVRRNVCRGLI